MSTHARGRQSEELACAALRAAGLRILETNYRCPHGELDIIAEHGELVCIVEVRSRAAADLGLPEETIDHRKRARLRRAAEHWVLARGERRQLRFDVVAILFGGPAPEVTWYPGAFEFDS